MVVRVLPMKAGDNAALFGRVLTMNKIAYLLFAIPAVSIVVVALSQVLDEMSKKEFILERRGRVAGDPVSTDVEKRRYSDSVPPGTLRNPETTTSGATAEVPITHS
jgi:hypothetical protein